MNSHLLSEVEMICDQVAILNKGSVVRTGIISELTAQKLIYNIQLSSPVSDDLKVRLGHKHFSLEFKDTSLNATLKDKSELNSIIDTLRECGIGIEGMTQQKTSLEDYFIQLVKGENGQ